MSRQDHVVAEPFAQRLDCPLGEPVVAEAERLQSLQTFAWGSPLSRSGREYEPSIGGTEHLPHVSLGHVVEEFHLAEARRQHEA